MKIEKELIELEKEIVILKSTLNDVDSENVAALTRKIEKLAIAVASQKGGEIELDPDRPKMEKVFIDPIAKDAGKSLEPHVDIESSQPKEEVAVDKQVEKLKSLLGKLPSLNE